VITRGPVFPSSRRCGFCNLMSSPPLNRGLFADVALTLFALPVRTLSPRETPGLSPCLSALSVLSHTLVVNMPLRGYSSLFEDPGNMVRPSAVPAVPRRPSPRLTVGRRVINAEGWVLPFPGYFILGELPPCPCKMFSPLNPPMPCLLLPTRWYPSVF